MKLSAIQRAYISGFLDGDGSVYVQTKRNASYRYGYQIAPAIVFFQSAKSEDSFKEFHRLLNLGNMRKRKDGILEITVNRIAEIRELISFVKPYVRMKRRQIELLEQILSAKEQIEDEDDFFALRELVDAYRNLNYSKKRKRIVDPVET